MKEYKSKWNKYNIGDVPWINDNRFHYCRKKFVDFVKEEDIKKIVEIGGGELIEAKEILSHDFIVDYFVVDVSDTFIKLAKTVKGLTCHKGEMTNIPLEDKQVDLIYCSSVLEHSPSIHETIKEMSRVSKGFYFNMFKWKMKTGNLKSTYRSKKKYYSSVFNIDMLIDLIKEYGNIKSMVVYGKNGGEIDFKEYRKLNNDIDYNRNQKYLSIRGIWE